MRLMFSRLSVVGVEHARALFQPAAVDADVGQVAVLVVDDLERQAAERLFGRQLARDLDLVLVLRIVPDDVAGISSGVGR